ncbi:MAG: hypothetical protein ACTSRN_09320 [Alphaproteobacteria bacterium]
MPLIKMSSSSNKKILMLTSGEQIPVARGRVNDVRNWLEMYDE